MASVRGSFAVLVTGFVFLAACNTLLGTCDLEATLESAGATGGGGSGAGVGGVGGAVPCEWCQPGMLLVPAEAGNFAIDAREVTLTEYQEFVATGLTPETAPELAPAALCGINESFAVGNATDAAYAVLTQDNDPAVAESDCQDWLTLRGWIEDIPVTCVDWCDAHAYCAWKGKRLCGGFDGEPYVISNEPNGQQLRHKDASVSQWFATCTGPLARAFPYGDVFDPAPCNDEDMSQVEPAHESCVGGYPGILDMSGNAAEWEAACSQYSNPDSWNQNCLLRGGASYQGADGGGGSVSVHEPLSCANRRENFLHLIGDNFGFRCCMDPPE